MSPIVVMGTIVPPCWLQEKSNLLRSAIRQAYAMDPRRLLVFRAVARAGSMSAGARELGWTQPAVSQHLARLERDLGTPLLLRGPTGTDLTAAGEALLRHADAVSARLEDAAAELATHATLGVGRVEVAAFPSGAAVLLPPVLRRLADAYPDLRVGLSEAEPPEAVGAVRSGEADLALTFVHEGQGAPEDLVSHPVGEAAIRLLVGRRHRLAGRRRIRYAEVADEPWIAGCERCRAHLVTVAATSGATEPDVRHTTDDFVLVQHLVAEGLGVALLPETALVAYRHPGVVSLPLREATPRRHLMLHRPGAERVPPVAAVLAAMGG